jgi:uncharacterized membrane protein YtjA (UPF0391 family)
MLSWAFMFLVLAIVAGVLGFSGIAGAATQIAWILFVVGLIAAVVLSISASATALIDCGVCTFDVPG